MTSTETQHIPLKWLVEKQAKSHLSEMQDQQSNQITVNVKIINWMHQTPWTNPVAR